MATLSQASGSQPASFCHIKTRRAPVLNEDIVAAAPDSDGPEESFCGSSASDGSLESSACSSHSSSVDQEEEEEELSDSEAEEEVSSTQSAAIPRRAASPQPQRTPAPAKTPEPAVLPAALQCDWFAQHAIPTTDNLEEALRSNGQLAYVPSGPAAVSAPPPSIFCPSKHAPCPAQTTQVAERLREMSPTSVLPGCCSPVCGAAVAWADPFAAQSPSRASPQHSSPRSPAFAAGPVAPGSVCGGVPAGGASATKRQLHFAHGALDSAGQGKSPKASHLARKAARAAAVYKTSAPSSLGIAAALASGRVAFPPRLERIAAQRLPSGSLPDMLPMVSSPMLAAGQLLPPSGLFGGPSSPAGQWPLLPQLTVPRTTSGFFVSSSSARCGPAHGLLPAL